MLFYYSIFLLIVVLLFISTYLKIPNKLLLIVLGVILTLTAGLKTVGVDMDSLTYVQVFNEVDTPVKYFTDYTSNSFLEPAYYLIPSILVNVMKLDVQWVFLVFAILGVSLKLFAISKLTRLLFLSVLVYFCHFFLLHELTQIRAGVASGFLLLSIIEIERRNLIRFVCLILLGTLFHYSLIVFLPFYFLSSQTINKKIYFGLLVVPYILVALNINVITLLQSFKLGVFSEKIEKYNDLLSLGVYDQLKTYSIVFLVQLFMCAIFIFKSELLLKNNKYAILLLKIYCIAAASLVMLSNIPVLAIRISEILNIVQIILIPFFVYLMKPRYAGLMIVVFYGLVIISINLLYVPILKPYFGNPSTWTW